MKIDDFGDNAPNFDAARQMCVLLAYVYNKDEAGFEAALGQGGTKKLWVQENGTWEPGFCVVQVADGSWLVVIEGTTSVTQFVAHLYGVIGVEWPYGKSLVNLFFYAAAKQIDEKLINILPQSGRTFIRFAGHSLGAGVATILAYMYRQRLSQDPPADLQVLTFGEPRSFSTDDIGGQPLNCHWRFVASGDLVPTLPPVGRYAIFARWANPLIPGQGQLTWVHTGTEIMLYEQGGRVPENDPDPIPMGWAKTFPDAHYIPNYWARLWLNWRNFGGNLPSDFDIKAMEITLANFPNVQITPELPSDFIGPDGNPVAVPNLFPLEVSLVVAQPTLMKHTWLFQDQNSATWREEFYVLPVTGSTQTRRTLLDSLPGNNDAIITNRLALLWKGHRLWKITANFVAGSRLAAVLSYNMQGTSQGTNSGADLNEADVTALSAVIQIYGINGAQRKLWMRGFAQGDVLRDSLTGFSYLGVVPRAAFNKLKANWQAKGYGVLTRVKKPSVRQQLPNAIVTVSGQVAGVLCNVTTAAPHGLANWDQIIIAQASTKDFPGLNGIWTVQVTPGATTVFQIPYEVPSNQAAVAGSGYVRPYTLNDLDLIDATQTNFAYAGMRKTNTPANNGKGRAKKKVGRLQR
jgi:hypothetical protein